MNGDEVLIAKTGKRITRILPSSTSDNISPRKSGIDKGKVIIMPGFDDCLPDSTHEAAIRHACFSMVNDENPAIAFAHQFMAQMSR